VNDKLSLLRSVVIYGANASGKSNIIKAFGFLKHFVTTSSRESQATDAIRVTPFVLDPYTVEAPTKFEVVFVVGGIQYRYGFSVNTTEVLSEWLYYCPSIREVELFTRDENGIHVGSKFREGRSLAEKTRKNALFLSVVSQFNGAIATELAKWLTDECNAVSAATDTGYLSYTLKCIEDGRYLEQIGALVSRLDLDIMRLSLVDLPTPSSRGVSDEERLAAVIVGLPGSVNKVLQTRHAIRDEDGSSVGEYSFPLAAESEGTQKLIALAGPIVDTLENGRVLFVDEIDARLHPLVTMALLQLFNSPETNPKNAQLICATHDTNLLDRRHFRRDQIYFVEKDRNAATRLFSLADFKLESAQGKGRSVRNDASFERDYIQGKYGAIPYIGDLHHLFAEELQETSAL